MIEFCGRCGGNRVKNATKKVGPRCTGCGMPSSNPMEHKNGRNAGGYGIVQSENGRKMAENIIKTANGSCIGVFQMTWERRATS